MAPDRKPRQPASPARPLTRIGLGMAAIGRPGYINLGHAEDLGPDRSPQALQRQAFELLDTAWRLGIRYVDAARSYGLAERFLGAWLATRPEAAGAVTVASKWGYAYTAGWRVDAARHEVKEHSLAQLRRQWRQSVEELGRSPQLYQIHSVTPDSGVLEDPAVLAELARLRESGTRIGLTTSGPDQAEIVRRSLEVEVDGRRLFDSVQSTWNLLERSAESALAAARQAGLQVVLKEVLANGRLTPRGDRRDREPLAGTAEAAGVGVDAVAIAAALSRPWADVVLSGAATPAQLRSNAAGAGIEPGQEDIERWGAMAEDSRAYWARRSELPWG